MMKMRYFQRTKKKKKKKIKINAKKEKDIPSITALIHEGPQHWFFTENCRTRLINETEKFHGRLFWTRCVCTTSCWESDVRRGPLRRLVLYHCTHCRHMVCSTLWPGGKCYCDHDLGAPPGGKCYCDHDLGAPPGGKCYCDHHLGARPGGKCYSDHDLGANVTDHDLWASVTLITTWG